METAAECDVGVGVDCYLGGVLGGEDAGDGCVDGGGVVDPGEGEGG